MLSSFVGLSVVGANGRTTPAGSKWAFIAIMLLCSYSVVSTASTDVFCYIANNSLAIAIADNYDYAKFTIKKFDFKRV